MHHLGFKLIMDGAHFGEESIFLEFDGMYICRMKTANNQCISFDISDCLFRVVDLKIILFVFVKTFQNGSNILRSDTID